VLRGGGVGKEDWRYRFDIEDFHTCFGGGRYVRVENADGYVELI